MSYSEEDAREDIMAEDAKKFLCLCEDEDIFEYLIKDNISVKDLVIAIVNRDDELHKRSVEEGSDAFGKLINELLNEWGENVQDNYDKYMRNRKEKYETLGEK